MEEIPKKSVLSPVMDRHESETTGDLGSELTRDGSAESGIRVEGSTGESCDSRCNVDARQNDYAGWTNEKHNSYLDYLEESFVKRLHQSSNLYRFQKYGKVEKPCSSPHDLQDDNYRSNRGLKRGRKQDTRFVPIHENLIASIAEASDQNFTDEDKEETSSCGPELKKLRKTTIVDDASSSDQVVPFGKTTETSISNLKHGVLRRDGRSFTMLRTDKVRRLKGC